MMESPTSTVNRPQCSSIDNSENDFDNEIERKREREKMTEKQCETERVCFN